MEKAFSLIKHKLVPADFAQYRQNLDEQLVCPTCNEQVFKKKLWVLSKQDHTHFFSHYFGDQDSCNERSKGEGGYENSRDHDAQLQRLEEFNKCFRENITSTLFKIVGKQSYKRLSSALEYSERLCTKKIENKELEKLTANLISSLDEPITSSINENLDDLEEALLRIYYHFKRPHGHSNLRFITCISLLLSFHKEIDHLEDILDKGTLKSKSNLSALMLGNAVLILANSNYVDWKGSIKPITSFLDPKTKTKVAPKKNTKVKRVARSPKATSGYFACIYCKKIHLFEFHNYKECTACHRWFYTHPTNKLKNSQELTSFIAGDLSNETAQKKINTKAGWIYCSSCNKHYFSENKTSCPHQLKEDIATSKPREEIKKLIRCTKCRANYIGYKDTCPYCSKSSSEGIRSCRGCGKGLMKSYLLPSKAGQTWRKCNFCNLNFEYKNF
jgi:hypothetical protein